MSVSCVGVRKSLDRSREDEWRREMAARPVVGKVVRVGVAVDLVFVVVGHLIHPSLRPLPGAALRVLGKKQGIEVGTAVRGDVLKRNRAYRQLVAAQFSSVKRCLIYNRLIITAVTSSCCLVPFENAVTLS